MTEIVHSILSFFIFIIGMAFLGTGMLRLFDVKGKRKNSIIYSSGKMKKTVSMKSHENIKSGVENTWSLSILTGFLSLWAFQELISVPAIFCKVDFRVVFYISVIFCLFFIMYSLVKVDKNADGRSKIKFSREFIPEIKIAGYFNGWKFTDWAAFLMLAAVIIVILYYRIFYYHTDADDSRFVVNAVDTMRTNRMLLNDPTTGLGFNDRYNDFRKDMVSPWYVFLAFGGKVSGISPTVFAHFVFYMLVFVIQISVISLISSEFFKEKFYRHLFILFVFLVSIYGMYNTHSQETVTLVRTWQGKAAMAAVGLPSLILCFLYIYRNPDEKKGYLLLMITNFSLCLMSSMGIIIGALMTAGYGVAGKVVTKKWKTLILTVLTALPNLIYAFISTFVGINQYLSFWPFGR